ncbi:MAG: hemerythrin family protein [Melioribacteraceae bacterium]|nr:hemerythrin family protein [Melioribacteraceae bacterium]
MRKMNWSPECKTGFDEIDSQHRLLFAISNELLDIENPVRQQDEIKYLLHHLLDYTTIHFKTEEEYFQKHNYPSYKEHKQRHEEILLEIKNTIKNSKSMTELKNNLDTMLDKWIKIHVLIEDKKFSTWAESKNIIQKQS